MGFRTVLDSLFRYPNEPTRLQQARARGPRRSLRCSESEHLRPRSRPKSLLCRLLRVNLAFRATQIAQWIYGHGAEKFRGNDEPLEGDSRSDWKRRARSAGLIPSKIRHRVTKTRRSTLFRLDGRRSGRGRLDPGSPPGNPLHLQSQAGCAYGCTFCATASMKAGRNLTSGEILGQVAALREMMARRGAGEVHNIVFMGMGEPLANYDQLVRSLRLLCGTPGFGIPARRITVSTVGLEPEIRRLAREPIGVRLAFSLNATTDEIRSRIMPVNRKYPFRSVFEALREYQHEKGEPVTLEYVLLSGVNDTPEDAERLARFGRSLQCKVNLIAYNPHRFAPYGPVPEARIEAFRKRMLPIAGRVAVTVRWSKGRDIQAACGQLATDRTG